MKPLNGHVLIEPIEVADFIVSQHATYQEIGKVIDGATLIDDGVTVLFDGWLAKKYPKRGEPNKFVWFVKYEDIVAYESIPKE